MVQLALPGSPGHVCGNLLPAGDQLHVGQPLPTWGKVGSGAGVGPWLLPHGPNPVYSISSLSLGASSEPSSWDEADIAEREGPWVDGLLEPPHLSSVHSCSWDLVTALAGGHRAILAIRPKARVPEAASVYRSSSSRHPPLAPSPLPESWCAPSGVRMAGGPRRNSSSAPRVPPPWDTCKPGPPRSQGARRTSQEESQTAPPKPSPSSSKVRPDPGRSRGHLRVSGCRSVSPAQGGSEEQEPEWPARPGSGPQGAGEGRCGRQP